jgi:signal transduction histidine kinase
MVRILRSLSRAEAITMALLDFARSGARPDPGARTDVGEVLRDLLGSITEEAEKLGIDLQLMPVPQVLVACAPGVYLSLVGNLVRNAIKYMGDVSTRKIIVRVTAEDSMVRTEVADTGPGIAPEYLPSLFEPYFRVGYERATEGLGLGLATVKKLAEGHHGSAGVTSTRGIGSTFWFLLPRAGTALPADEEKIANPGLNAPSGMHH